MNFTWGIAMSLIQLWFFIQFAFLTCKSESSLMGGIGGNLDIESKYSYPKKIKAAIAETNCQIQYNNATLVFQKCLSLEGGFQLSWNISGLNSSTSSYTISAAFSGSSNQEWIGFGESESGQMVGSNVIVGYPSENGIVVKQYYLSGKLKSQVNPGGYLNTSNLEGEYQGNANIIIRFTLQLSSAKAESSTYIWTRGLYAIGFGDTLGNHDTSYSGSISFIRTTKSIESKDCFLTYQKASIPFQSCTTLEGNYGFLWNLTSSSDGQYLVTAAVNHSVVGYFSLGFGKKMVGSYAIIARNTQSGIVVKQYYLGGTDPNQNTPSNGLALEGIQGEKTNDAMTFLFSLSIPSDQISDWRVLWSQGPYSEDTGDTIPIHSRRYYGSINLLTSESSSSSKDTLKDSHGILNTIAWGILIPLGILIARYLRKQDPLWFYLHMSIQVVGFGLALGGFITGIKIKNRGSVTEQPHFGFAILILIISCLQVTALLLRPKKDGSWFRWSWELFHHWGGRIVLGFAIANIFIGFDLLDPPKEYKIAFYVVLGIWCASFLVLELLSLLGVYKRLPNKYDSSNNNGDVQKYVNSNVGADGEN